MSAPQAVWFVSDRYRPICRYKDNSEKNLVDSLVNVTDKLGKFKNVNKKAMDQNNQFTDQVLHSLFSEIHLLKPNLYEAIIFR